MVVRRPCYVGTFVSLTEASYYGDRWMLRGAARQMVRNNVEDGPSLRRNGQE